MIMMYIMNSYNVYFSFAGTLLAASDKPMNVFTSFARKYGHLTSVTRIKDQDSKCIGEYVRLFQITESYFIHIIMHSRSTYDVYYQKGREKVTVYLNMLM